MGTHVVVDDRLEFLGDSIALEGHGLLCQSTKNGARTVSRRTGANADIRDLNRLSRRQRSRRAHHTSATCMSIDDRDIAAQPHRHLLPRR
jgi:hypothetical protein